MPKLLIYLLIFIGTVGAIRNTLAGDAVSFIVGDYLVSESGSWDPSESPLSGPFGIDFDSGGRLYIVELTSGRLHRIDVDSQVTTISDQKKPGYSGDGGPLQSAHFNGPHNCVVGADDSLWCPTVGIIASVALIPIR